MAKKPIKLSVWRRLASWAIGKAKRNPLATIATLVGIIAGIPGAAIGLSYSYNVAEPSFLAQHGWVRDHTDDKLKQPLTVIAQHAVDIDYLILKEQRRALSEAKDDLKRDPNSTSAPAVIDNLQRSIDERQRRLDAATKK